MLSLAGVIQIEKFAPKQAASTGEFLDHHTSAPSALPDRQALVSPAKLLASRAILALGKWIRRSRHFVRNACAKLFTRSRTLGTVFPVGSPFGPSVVRMVLTSAEPTTTASAPAAMARAC